MKTYSVYHLPQFIHPDGRIGKVGCTSYDDPRKRAIEQSYTFNDFEVLEQYEDIYVASDREIELQKEYGYPVDKIPYWQSVQNRYKFTKKDSAKGGRASIANMRSYLTKEILSNAGKAGGRKHVESGHLERIRDPKKAGAASRRKVKCIHCGKEAATYNHARWHGDNCKTLLT